MADEWIKVLHTTPDKPEVLHMADMLEIDPDAVCGKLLRLWIWGEQQSFDDDAQMMRSKRTKSAPKASIDLRAKVPGFADSMLKVGWLTQNDDGTVSFFDFSKHNGKAAKRKALAAKRRDKSRAGANDALLVRKRCARKRVKKKVPSYLIFSSLNDLPEGLKTEEFLMLWRDWIAHREAIKKKLSESTVKKQLEMLSRIGLPRALTMVRHTITMGWTGLREPESKEDGPTRCRVPTDDELANWNAHDGGLSG